MYKCSGLFINVLHQRTVHWACARIWLRYTVVFAAQMPKNWTEKRGACCTLFDLLRSLRAWVTAFNLLSDYAQITLTAYLSNSLLSTAQSLFILSQGIQLRSCLGVPGFLWWAFHATSSSRRSNVDLILCLIHGTRVISSTSRWLRLYSPSWRSNPRQHSFHSLKRNLPCT